MPEWVSCRDRFPEIDTEVNVWLDYMRSQVATMRFAGFSDFDNSPIWYWHNSEDLTTLTPKAWRPLPQPPQEDE